MTTPLSECAIRFFSSVASAVEQPPLDLEGVEDVNPATHLNNLDVPNRTNTQAISLKFSFRSKENLLVNKTLIHL